MLCSILFFSLRIYTNKTLFKPKLERGITLSKLDTDVHGARELHAPWIANHNHRGVQVGPDKLEVVASFCYLGDMLSAASGCELSPTTCPVAVNFQPQYMWKPPGRSSRSCYQFSLPATALSRHVATCTALVCGAQYSMQVRLDHWQSQSQMTGQWSDRSAMSSRKIFTTRSNELLARLGIEDLDLILKERRLCSYGHVEHSNGAVKTAFDIQVDGKRRPERPKMTQKMTQRDCREWMLSAIDPHDRHTWRSGVRSAMHAANQLPGRRPIDVDVGPVLYFCVCVSWMLSNVILFII